MIIMMLISWQTSPDWNNIIKELFDKVSFLTTNEPNPNPQTPLSENHRHTHMYYQSMCLWEIYESYSCMKYAVVCPQAKLTPTVVRMSGDHSEWCYHIQITNRCDQWVQTGYLFVYFGQQLTYYPVIITSHSSQPIIYGIRQMNEHYRHRICHRSCPLNINGQITLFLLLEVRYMKLSRSYVS